MKEPNDSKAQSPDWDRLYEIAAGQSGYFTTAQAGLAGYSRPLLAKYLQNNRIKRVDWGIYRLVHFPPSEHEELVQLRLRFKRKAVFSHETALSLHGLSDVLPSLVHITLPEEWRRRRLKIPRRIEIYHEDLKTSEITWIGPLQATTPAKSIIECAEAKTSPELVEQAIEQGIARGLFERGEIAPALRYVEFFKIRGN